MSENMKSIAGKTAAKLSEITVKNVVKGEATRAIAGTFFGGIGTMLAGNLLDLIFPSGDTSYFGVDYEKISDIVGEKISEEVIADLNGKLQGIQNLFQIDYANARKLRDPNKLTDRQELYDMLDRRKEDITYVISELAQDIRRLPGFPQYLLAITLHMTILQEMANVDPHNVDSNGKILSPSESEHCMNIKKYAGDYVPFAVKTWEKMQKNRAGAISYQLSDAIAFWAVYDFADTIDPQSNFTLAFIPHSDIPDENERVKNNSDFKDRLKVDVIQAPIGLDGAAFQQFAGNEAEKRFNLFKQEKLADLRCQLALPDMTILTLNALVEYPLPIQVPSKFMFINPRPDLGPNENDRFLTRVPATNKTKESNFEGLKIDLLIPGNFSGGPYTDLLLYDRANGSLYFYTTNGSGELFLLKSHIGTWDKDWDLIIPGNFGGHDQVTDLLFYSRARGTAEYYTVSKGDLTLLHQDNGTWSKDWDLIIPGNFGGHDQVTDLLFYSRARKTGVFYKTYDGALDLLNSHIGTWENDWDMIVPGNFGGNDQITDLLFYSRARKTGVFYETFDGALKLLNSHVGTWDNDWDMIIPGNFSGGDQITDLLFYSRARGTGVFYATNKGALTLLNSYIGTWNKDWTMIIRGILKGGSIYHDLFAYHS